MAIAFRQYATGGGSSASSVTCDKPTGTVDGDILIAKVYLENTGDTVTATGWTHIRTETTAGTVPFRQVLYWKRAASEGASYDFSWTNSVWSHATILAYSGCLASGDVIDDHDGAVDAAVEGTNYYTAPSLTTTVANTMLVYSCETVTGNSIAPDPAMTERVEFDCGEFADEARAATGATGTRAAEEGVAANQSMAMAMIALKPAGAQYSGAVWGEQNPTNGEEPKSWQLCKLTDGRGIPYEGSADWGKARVFESDAIVTDVIDTALASSKRIFAGLHRYGSGDTPSVYVRGSDTSFGMYDGSPSWSLYTGTPLVQTWRYVQLKLVYA